MSEIYWSNLVGSGVANVALVFVVGLVIWIKRRVKLSKCKTNCHWFECESAHRARPRGPNAARDAATSARPGETTQKSHSRAPNARIARSPTRHLCVIYQMPPTAAAAAAYP